SPSGQFPALREVPIIVRPFGGRDELRPCRHAFLAHRQEQAGTGTCAEHIRHFTSCNPAASCPTLACQTLPICFLAITAVIATRCAASIDSLPSAASPRSSISRTFVRGGTGLRHSSKH